MFYTPNGWGPELDQPILTLPNFNFVGIYEVKENPVSKKEYFLERLDNKFTVPKKLYGKLNKYIKFYWNAFKRHNFKTGLLLTGAAGAGKTEIAKILSNKCIDAGMKVITIDAVDLTNELLGFLDMQDNCVLFFDEFAKKVNYQTQERMLTLLSNPYGKQRIVIMTENDPDRISNFILNRPGRVKYHLHFDKLEVETIEEYCNEKNVDPKFYKEFIKVYRKLVIFTFDHLKAIVDEHLANPDMSFEELVKLLNLQFIKGRKYLELKSVKYKDNKIDMTYIDVHTPNLTYDDFIIDYWFRFSPKYELKDKIPDINLGMVQVKKGDVTYNQNGKMKAKVNDWELEFDIVERRS